MLVVGDGGATGARAGVDQPRDAIATVGDSEALSSTWYCSAGSIGEEGPADHVLVLANGLLKQDASALDEGLQAW